MKVKIATFNLENLFARYRFRQDFNPNTDDGFLINDLAFNLYDEEAKRITGKVIKEAKADIICLQEIENLNVLERFNSKYLAGQGYKHRILIDSHDPRYIDVGILSKYPIISAKSYRHERNKKNTAWLFSRDCLEVDIKINRKTLTVYNNHFKSMMGGRDATKARRLEQSKKVKDIIDQRWKSSGYKGNFVVVGDLNDYPDNQSALKVLLNHSGLENVLNRLPVKDRWTHFYKGGNFYSQLDYIFISKGLSEKNKTTKPTVIRKGLPFRAEKYTGERLDNIGEHHPKASDHALLAMELKLV